MASKRFIGPAAQTVSPSIMLHPRAIAIIASLVLLFAQVASAHPIPEIPVRSYFQQDGSVTITVEIDPRCFSADPTNEPSLLKWVLASLDESAKAAMKQKAKTLVGKSVEFLFEPTGPVQPDFSFAFTGQNGAPLATDEDIAVLSGTWITQMPADAKVWRIRSTKEATLAVVFRNFLEDRQHTKFSVLFPGETSFAFDPRVPAPALQHIVFGSCLDVTDHPMLNRTLGLPMDLFLFMGDNIYADTQDMSVMREKYMALFNSAFYQTLRAQTPILATWDDHDYGVNDGGADNPVKREAQREFLTWLNEPAGSPLWKQEGVYHASVFGPPGQRVQVIMLDTRYFRSPTDRANPGDEAIGGPHLPTRDTTKTILGEAQWKWLEAELHKPAELRLIVSSIQFAAAAVGQETWANFPHEQQRLLKLIEDTKASGVLVLSGDRHWCELSKIDGPLGYPIFDLTASSMTQVHKRGTPTENANRALPKTFHQPNVGTLDIDWQTGDANLTLRIVDESGNAAMEKTLRLSELKAQ